MYKIFMGDGEPENLEGKTVIVIDDGIATGATMRAAIMGLREMNPAKLIVAVPVAATNTCEDLIQLVDQFVCPLQPENFYAIGQWYEDFSQTSDEEVRTLLNKAMKGIAHDQTHH